MTRPSTPQPSTTRRPTPPAHADQKTTAGAAPGAAPRTAPWTGTPRAGGTSLVDLLDRVVDRGAVVNGDVIIQLAGIDLIRLDLRLLLIGIESATEMSPPRPITARTRGSGRAVPSTRGGNHAG